MIVLTISNCPPKLRGDLSKWLLEINTGVYVGRVSARVPGKEFARISVTDKLRWCLLRTMSSIWISMCITRRGSRSIWTA